MIASTPRLLLRKLAVSDAPFYLQIVNQPSWLANIGDRKLHSVDAAGAYIRDKAFGQYAQHGYGMYVIERRGDGAPVGLCGLVRRDALPGPDLGFALLEDEWGMGYAREAATAVCHYAFGELALDALLAITLPHNTRSVSLLEKLGFERDGTLQINGDSLLRYALRAGRTLPPP